MQCIFKQAWWICLRIQLLTYFWILTLTTSTKKDYHSSEQIQNVQNNKNLQINETYDWLGLEENILYLTRIGITISISVVGIVIQCCRN